jgi:hypothetical protein
VLSVPFGLFGISVSGILKTIAKLLFNVLAGAFLPGWLRNAPREALTWQIALPNPADAVQWPTMHRLEQDTTAVAVAILPMTFAISAARYTASGVTGGAHHPAESIGRLLGAAIGLLLFGWAFENAVAAVNVTTSALLSFGSIDHGLHRPARKPPSRPPPPGRSARLGSQTPRPANPDPPQSPAPTENA